MGRGVDVVFEQAMREQVTAWYAPGRIRPLVAERFPFAALPEALAAPCDRSVSGKILRIR